MKLTATKPEVGRKYWWIRVSCKSPELLTVEKVTDPPYGGIKLSMTDAFYKSATREVVWNWQEWEHAAGDGGESIQDYLPPVKKEDLTPDEELCRVCNGGRWEFTRDSDVLPCMWCGMEGKRKRREPIPPTHSRRSDHHPELPIKEKE